MRIAKSIVLFLVLLSFKNLYSQEVFQVQENFKKIKFDSYIKVLRTKDSILTPNLISDSNSKWRNNKVSYGFSEDFYWLRFTIKNEVSHSKDLYLEINNPHIKYIEFYKFIDNDLELLYHCGDYLPFDSRPIASEKFVFPIELKSGKSATYYVKIDKKNTSVSFPTFLIDAKEFIKNSNNSKLLDGILFGGIMICFLYSIFAYFYIKKLLFLWYSLYAISLGLYLFTTLGYSFQYLYPNNVVFTSFFRIVTLIFGVVFLLKFTQKLLKTNVYIRKVNIVIDGLVYSLLMMLLIWFIFPNLYRTYIAIMVKAVYFLMLLSMVSFFLSAFLIYAKQKSIVRLYLFSFGALIFCGFGALLLEFGFGQELRLNIPFLLVGALVQIIILGIGLFYEISLIYSEKKNLSIKIAQKQHEIVQAYLDGMEKERLRISNELHDDIGSKLANFIRLVLHDNLLPNKFIKKIKYIMEDVRRISHELTPANRTLLSFKEQLDNLIEETFFTEKIKCEFHFLGANMTLSQKRELSLYRVFQEFLQNIVKHSKSTLVEVQFISNNDELTITIEDNGIGFNINDKHKGIGLQNIQKRIDYLKGTLEISSVEGVGTFVVIVIPLND